MRPTDRTTARSRSAWSFRATSKMPSKQCACAAVRAPVFSRGGGTSLCGQCCNVAVILDFSKYLDKIIELDPQQRLARVQPVSCSTALRTRPKSITSLSPPIHRHTTHCTIGGMIGNNSCGVHSVMAGKTDANVEELDVLLYDGVRMRRGRAGRRGPGRTHHSGRRTERRNLRQACALRDKYAEEIRRALSARFRGEFPVMRWTICCRKKDSTWPRPWSAPRRRA